MPSYTYRANFDDGTVNLVNTDHRSSAERIAELEHALRVARFDLETTRQELVGVRRNTRTQLEENEATIRRVGALVNRKRKTLSMVDLITALESDSK